MVQPRLSAGTNSKYWLRARSGATGRNHHHGSAGKILVSVDSLHGIFKPDKPNHNNNIINTPKSNPKAITSPTIIRKSRRLFEKRAAKTLMRGAGPHEYWLRTRTTSSRIIGTKRSSPLLVSVKSLYAVSESQESHECEEKCFKGCSGCCQQTSPQRRRSARLFEKRAASLLSCRTTSGRRGTSKISKFKRKKKHLCWLYKGTPWLGVGSCYNASKFSAHVRSRKASLQLDSSDHSERNDRSGDMTASPSGKVRFHDPAFRPALQRLTERGEEDVLQCILEKLPPATLLQAARVCRSWARLCEPAFREECHRKGWSLPRLPRGATPAFPWRSLYYRHACRACGKVGEFFVRKTLNGNFQFLLCGGCIRLPDVRKRLVQYSIDLYGVTGKLLAPNVSSRGAC